MEKLDSFKLFVKNNPRLLRFIKDKSNTWQDFYEMYDLYGETGSVWDEYLIDKVINDKVSESNVKKFDMDSIENGMNSLQRVVGLISELASKDKVDVADPYKPRPLYKHFED